MKHAIAPLSVQLFTPLAVIAAPPPSSLGVWDWGAMFDTAWSEAEKNAGVFDWSELGRVVERAFKDKSFVYLALGVAPALPEWIYTHGVLDSLPSAPTSSPPMTATVRVRRRQRGCCTRRQR